MVRRLPLALVGICLALTASAGAAAQDNKYTAVSTPSFVQPAPAAPTYTITLTNDPAPSGEADRATVTPPAGFHVLGPPATLSANVTGCGNVDPWSAEVLADGKLAVRRTNGSANNLCPGGSLVVTFSATADTPGDYEWGVELRRGDDPLEPAFILRQAQLAVHVDGPIPPETTINSGPPALTNSTSASFTFSSEAGATFECSLDSDAFTTCTSPTNYSGLPAGARTFKVRAIDQDGNVDPTPATHNWTIDVTAPNTSIASGPSGVTNSTGASFTFSSEAGATFQCSLDSAAFTTCTSPQSYTNLPEGTRTFEVRAIDQAGNVDASPAARSWTIDITPPDTIIGSSPPAFSKSKNASFTFSSEPGATFKCRLDGGAFNPCTSPKNYTDLPEGSRTFEVRAIDEAGNEDATPAAHNWTIDVTAPNTSIDSGPSNLTNSTSASFTFSSEAGATFQCSLDGAEFTTCTSPQSYTNLPEGTRTFEVRAIDQAGNVDASPAARSWTIDVTPPNTTIASGPSAVTNSTSATFTFSSEAGATFECNLDGAGFTGCTSPKVYNGLPGGARSFAVRATDPAGNVGAAATRNWTIDLNGPPTSISSGPPAVTNSSSASFTFASEAAATFECSLDGVLFSACTSPKGYDGLSDGPHSFAVRAVDTANNTGPASARTWTIDTRPPVAAVSSGPPALTNSRSAAFAFSADEASSFVCRLDGGAFQPCTSPTSYGQLGDGAHTFAVRATDAVGNVGNTASSAWTIDAIAPDTTLISGPRSGTAATSATFTFRANEAVSFECKLDAAAFAPCISPKGYARMRKTRHTFAVRAIDRAGNIDATPATHHWTIAAAPRTVKKTSALLAPEAGARVKAPPRLAWRRAAGAAYYNVQLFRRGVKVLSAWPTRPRLQLRARWTYLGRRRTLSPGTYRWYVWPAFKNNRYGRVLGQSTFIVTVRFR